MSYQVTAEVVHVVQYTIEEATCVHAVGATAMNLVSCPSLIQTTLDKAVEVRHVSVWGDTVRGEVAYEGSVEDCLDKLRNKADHECEI